MITAVDTSVLVDVIRGDPTHGAASVQALKECVVSGGVIASDVVWAETATGFGDLERFREVMARLGVEIAACHGQSAEAASRAWRTYRSQGGPRARIMADFLVGAHAMLQAERLLTRDRGFYRRYFSDLPLLVPAQG